MKILQNITPDTMHTLVHIKIPYPLSPGYQSSHPMLSIDNPPPNILKCIIELSNCLIQPTGVLPTTNSTFKHCEILPTKTTDSSLAVHTIRS